MIRAIVTVAKFTTINLVRGGRGLSMLLLTLILATLPGLIIVSGEQPLELGGRAQAQTLMRLYNFSVMRELAGCPSALVISGIITFSALPLATLILAFDTIARERELGTLRFSCMRARWSSIIIGKSVAIWTVYAGICLLSYSPVWLAEIIRSKGLRFEALTWGGRLYSVMFIQAIAFVSIWILVSCFFRRAWVSFVVGIGLISVMGFLRRALHESRPPLGKLLTCLPGTVDELLLGRNVGQRFVGIAVACIWSIVVLSAAAHIFNRVKV